METSNHFKNGAIPKSQMSKGNNNTIVMGIEIITVEINGKYKDINSAHIISVEMHRSGNAQITLQNSAQPIIITSPTYLNLLRQLGQKV